MSRLNTGYLGLLSVDSRCRLVGLVMVVVVGWCRVLDMAIVVLVVWQGLRKWPRWWEMVRVVLSRHLGAGVGRSPVQLSVPFRMVN